MPLPLPKITVTCAVIYNSAGHILLTKRSAAMSNPLLWEFPGGKLEPNETPRACLAREIKEELGLEIALESQLGTYSYQYPKFEIELLAFSATLPQPDSQPILTEHCAYCWVPPQYLLAFDISPADVEMAKELVGGFLKA